MPPLPNAGESHTVPSAFWKVIASCEHIRENCRGETPKLAAFIMPQSADRTADVMTCALSVDEVEMRSHLHLMPDLQDDTGASAVSPGWLTSP